MSPRHVRIVAAVAAAFVLAPAVVVLSASTGTFAAAALHSYIAPRPPWPVVDDPALTRQAVPLSPAMTGALELNVAPVQNAEAEDASPSARWRAAATESAHASPPPNPLMADQTLPALLPPPPSTWTERPPFALTLLVETAENGISQAVSPLPYSDRSACELAGQQWGLELEQSGTATSHAMAICVSQAANLLAMRARLQATMPGAESVP